MAQFDEFQDSLTVCKFIKLMMKTLWLEIRNCGNMRYSRTGICCQKKDYGKVDRQKNGVVGL